MCDGVYDGVCDVVCDFVDDSVSGDECCGKVELLILSCLGFLISILTFLFAQARFKYLGKRIQS